MHISRRTNQELVVIDSSIWISITLLGIAPFVTYEALIQNKPKGLIVAGVLLLFSFPFWRRETIIFDAARQQAIWIRRRAFKIVNGTVAFSEVTGIGVEAISGNHGTLTYRLTILTQGKPVPMSDEYGGNLNHYESLRTEILKFLHLDAAEAQLPAAADEASIRSLLMQGRKVDAIELARSSWKIGLSEAVDRVNQIDEKMKAAQ